MVLGLAAALAAMDGVVIEPFAAIIDGGAELLPMLGNHDYRFGEQ